MECKQERLNNLVRELDLIKNFNKILYACKNPTNSGTMWRFPRRENHTQKAKWNITTRMREKLKSSNWSSWNENGAQINRKNIS